MSHVIPDIKPFRDNTGTVIEGRRQWREHLARRDLVELGPSDIAQTTGVHERRRREAAERAVTLASQVIGQWTEPQPLPEREIEKKRLWCKVAERLEYRESPNRKELIRIVVEEMKRGH